MHQSVYMIVAALLAGPSEFRIDTYIGGGLPSNVPATETTVWVSHMAVDASGAVYLTANKVVRKIESGLIETVAGRLPPLLVEDNGGEASEAYLAASNGIAVDQDGGVIVCDTLSDVIRRIDPDGTIHTIAGQWGVSGSMGSGGPAVLGTLQTPFEAALAGDGSLFFTQFGGVRKIDPQGILTDVAGDGTPGTGGYGDGGPALAARFQSPKDIVLDSAGRIYVADSSDGRIRRVELDGTIDTIAGTGFTVENTGDGGPATSAKIGQPCAVALDSNGGLAIGDAWNGVVRYVDSQGIITTIAGTGSLGYSGDGGPATLAQFGKISDLEYLADGSLLVTDTTTYRIRRIHPDGTVSTFAGNGTFGYGGDGLHISQASFEDPSDIVFAEDGTAFVADVSNNRVRQIDADGFVSTIAGNGTDGTVGLGGPAIDAQLGRPKDLALHLDGSLYVLTSWSWLRVIDANGDLHHVAGTGENNYNGDGRPAETAAFDRPEDIFVDAHGTVYIADTNNNRVRMIDGGGLIQTVAGDGGFSGHGDGGPATSASLNRPGGLLVLPNGEIYISELSGHRIRHIDTNGVITTVVGTGTGGFSGDGGPASAAEISVPVGLYMGPDGSLYFSDSGNYRVRRIDPDGFIAAVAGNGSTLYNGDNLPAVEATLRRPLDLAADPRGRIYVANGLSGRIRVLKDITDVSVAVFALRSEVSGSQVQLTWDTSILGEVQHRVLKEATRDVLGEVRSSRPGAVTFTTRLDAGIWSVLVEARSQGGSYLGSAGPLTFEVKEAQSTLRLASGNPARGVVRAVVSSPGERVRVQIYDLRGRRVATLFDGVLSADSQTVTWTGQDSTGRRVGTGTYFLEARSGTWAQTRKIVWQD